MHLKRLSSFDWGLVAIGLVTILLRAWIRAACSEARSVAGGAAWGAALLAGAFLFLGVSALMAWRGWGGAAVRLRGEDGRFLRLVALALGGTLGVGASGAASSFGDRSSLEDELAFLHPLAAVVVSLVLLRLASAVRRRRRRPAGPPGGAAAADAAVRWANRLHVLVFAQLALGTLNTVVVDRVWIEAVHLGLAFMVWIAAVLTSAASLPGRERE